MIIVMEGLDRTGKDTQIKMLQTEMINRNLYPFHVLHYSGFSGIKDYKKVYEYSKQYYMEMFSILEGMLYQKRNAILNRAHLGEYVYGNLYREYDGSYVFGIEKFHKFVIKNVKLFVFIDKAENLIKRDDGLSFTTLIEKKQMEIDKFKEAFEKSNIKNKTLINISNMSIDFVYQIIRSEIFKD